jgi:GNAT superfamily N-acetyltransferase
MNLTFQVELARKDAGPLIAEIALLARECWVEMKFPEQDFAPNLPSILALWATGLIVGVTARDAAGTAQGYILWSKVPATLTADIKQATMLGVYMRPEARASGNAFKLRDFSIELLKGQGVTRFLASVPVDGPAKLMFEQGGFKPLETVMELRL